MANTTEKNTQIDMTYPRMSYDDPNIVMRYCASSLSIPADAFGILNIYDKNMETFNEYTNMPYGFSYKIQKDKDPQPFTSRKIEKEIAMNRWLGSLEIKDHLLSYDNFINYYDDEEFSEPIDYSSYYYEKEQEERDNQISKLIELFDNIKKTPYELITEEDYNMDNMDDIDNVDDDGFTVC